MGVLTHLDFFKENKQMRKMKKNVKKRFGVEVNPETKLFYLSGIKNDYYLKRDVFITLNFL